MRILVVDDEPLTRRGVAKLVEDSPAAQLVETAEDGFAALELLERKAFDLVITDIRMPEMSGLELMNKAKEAGYCDAFLVLSSYAEFQYAQKAVELGALAYLLNPVDRLTLAAALEKAESTITSRKEKARLIQAARIHRHVVHGPAQGEAAPVEDGVPRQVILLEPEAQLPEGRLEPLLRECAREYSIVCLHQGLYLVLLQWQVSPSRQQTAALLCELAGLCGLPPHHLAASGVGTGGPLSLLYREALYGLLRRSPDEALPSDLPWKHINLAELAPPLYGSEQDAQVLESLLTSLAQAYGIQPRHNDAFLRMLLAELAARYPEIRSANPLSGTSRDALFQALLNALRSLAAPLDQEAQAKVSANVNRVIQYTLSHCLQKDLTLDRVAKELGIHPNYLSTMFSKEMGVSWIRYLTALRLRYARKLLLLEPRLPVQVVAAQCGFDTPNHFFRMFKRNMKMTPGEYRKRQGGEAAGS